MKAMVLAAGEGTRLRPLTLETPKALLPVAGVPLIFYILGWLRGHGLSEVVVNLHHLGEKVVGAVGDGSRLGMTVRYSPEETLLGTAGAVKKVADLFDGTFVVVYGDVLTDCDLSALIRFHQRRQAVATLALSAVANPSEAGIVQLREDGRVTGFVEKPPPGSNVGNLANGGVYVLEREVLGYVPARGPSDFGYDVLPEMVRDGLPVYGYHLPRQTYLIDIGSPENYRRAGEDVAAGKCRIVPSFERMQRW